MNRYSILAVLVAGSLPFTVGCSTKKYVRNQTTPIINNVNELDDQTAKNTRDIRDVDNRAQQGISQVNSKAAAADQKALAAGQSADQANQNATQASNRVTSLAGTVENLDNYKPVTDTTVLFAFDKAQLTRKDKQTLDEFGEQVQGQKHFIVQVEGYTDSTGSADYNYQLSQRRADAVIAFGSDATMASLRAQTRWNQIFIAHGHALSLLWISNPNQLTPRQASACARDILTYDQLGCLSPQAIYVPRGADIDALGSKLAHALEAHWRTIKPKPLRPLSVAARIVEARDVAHALGHRVWLPPQNHLGWMLIHDPDPTFQPSPLRGVIYLREVAESKLNAALASVAGRISTVGVAGEISSRLENVFLSLGVSRFCAAGRMQFPPLTWHHDGRSSLADLVTWVDSGDRA